ncbi:Cytochrome P450 [Penicillium maclennaniae]|uniref:Cytochrome P450 n=1 Tax=Penicillium maclennaniae TaxID=1343394 RepID=UPI0025405EFB|nr:Cytochrome P450 [Penicillium maclennaniae]KAJ5684364.1 Cytochrome P450 [Penicillium maclennaniae]
MDEMISMPIYWPDGLGITSRLGPMAILLAVSLIFALMTVLASIITSKHLANKRIPFATGSCLLSILYQQYQFVANGPELIKRGYSQFSDGLFEIPRTFRFGQIILCKPELIEELKNTRSTVTSPEPWIDQLLQISHVMPGYFPKGGGWPAIARTTPGLIRGTVYKQLDQYEPSMNDAILSQLDLLEFKNGECMVNCFDFAYSVVARSGSFAMVGSRLSQDEEYLKAVKDHILGMIVTTRVQFLIPDCLKRYVGGFVSRLISLGTRWNMHTSRKILLKHFDARAAEYRNEINGGDNMNQANPEQTHKPIDDFQVEIFRWLYESSVLRQRWTYSEVIGEMLLLQFAFIYTTAYGLYGALAELAQHPQYIQPLREEIESVLAAWGATVTGCDRMILLDSFMKECQRLHPPAAISAHRVCISELKLSNGIVLKPGTHVGVPSGRIQRSPSSYEHPETFDGFRFAKRAAAGASNTRLVDLSPDYLVFGMGVHACPGRWMASALMKLVFAHILLHFDVLPGSAGPLTGSLSFEEFYVPNFGLRIRLRQK